MSERFITPPDPASTPGIVPEDGDLYQWSEIEDMVCPHCGASYRADMIHVNTYETNVTCPVCEKSDITITVEAYRVRVGEGRA